VQLTSDIDEGDPMAQVEQPTQPDTGDDLTAYVADAVQQLPEREARIISMKFGFDGQMPMDYSQIGEVMGMTKQRAHQIARDAMQTISAAIAKQIRNRGTSGKYSRLRQAAWRYVREFYPQFYKQRKADPKQQVLFDDDSHPRAKESVTIGGTKYRPGEWIPKDKAAQASPKEAEKIEDVETDIDEIKDDDFEGESWVDGFLDPAFEAHQQDRWRDSKPFPQPDYVSHVRPNEQLTPQQAKQRVEQWKARAKEIGETEDNAHKIVFSLFDRTGVWSQPWADAGYTVLQYDIEHGDDLMDFFPIADIMNAVEKGYEIFGVLAAPPCTTMTSSGARWWKQRFDVANEPDMERMWGAKALQSFDSPHEYNVQLVENTSLFVELAAPTGFYAVENPRGRIAEYFHEGEVLAPTMVFNPHNYGDPYTKETRLWGEFDTDLPTANVEPTLGSLIHKMSSGDPSRSVTPEGFAYAFFMANHPGAQADKPPKQVQRQLNYRKLDPAMLRQAVQQYVKKYHLRFYAKQLGFNFDENSHPRAKDAVTIGSTSYVPGEFIPKDQAAQATPAEAAKIEGMPAKPADPESISVTYNGATFATGKPVTFEFMRGTTPAQNFGSRFQQDIEPAGRYMIQRESGDLLPGWESGTVTFHNPLVVPFNWEPFGGYDDKSWKVNLSQKFKGKKGKSLSKAIAKAGYDGIVTVSLGPDGKPYDTREIVDLTSFHGEKPAVNKPVKASSSITVSDRPSGDGIYHTAKVGRKKVGHIGGFVRSGKGGSELDITNVEFDPEYRGKGYFQETIKRIAGKYPAGLRVRTWQASTALKKAIGKMPGWREDGDSLVYRGTFDPADKRINFSRLRQDVLRYMQANRRGTPCLISR
jgi:hypothetical protein